MVVLYICSSVIEEKTGGGVVTKSNLEVLERLATVVKYQMPNPTTPIAKANSLLFFNRNGYSAKEYSKIRKFLKASTIDRVFIETSQFGKLTSRLKNDFPQLPITTFFHNCEYVFWEQNSQWPMVSIKKRILKSVAYNERRTILNSDNAIFMNRRDLNDVERVYAVPVKKWFLSPLSLEDFFTEQETRKCVPSRLLFVGSNFGPNLTGLKWFVESVLPFVDYSLTVVGRGFREAFMQGGLGDKVTFLGFVPDLSTVYAEADIVIGPVFWGSGMKAKTAEALMFGKTLLATSESLSGYEVDGVENIYRCDSKESFIEILGTLKKSENSRFNENVRRIFLERYSLFVASKTFREVLGMADNAV